MNLSENAGNLLTPEDSRACILLGGYEGIWRGVAEAQGVAWSGFDHHPSIALGIATLPSDFAP